MANTKSFFILVLLIISSCTTAQKTYITDTNPNHETIVLMGINDLHGTLAPIPLQTREAGGVEPIAYEAGGAAYLAFYAKHLKSQYGSRLLILDAGDEFQGTIESNIEKGATVVQFFNTIGINAAAIGNHEFDFGPETKGNPDVLSALKARLTEAKYPYVAANIVEKKTGQLVQWPNTKPHVLLSAGRLKVGVIGLATLQTPVTTRAEYVQSLSFTDLKTATIREAEALRKEGANVVALNAHVGLRCERDTTWHPGNQEQNIRTPSDLQGECNEQDELVKLIRALPEGTVDAVISGHTHQIIHHWVANVPVVQGGANGRYFNLIYLTYDLDQKKVLANQTRIEGPVPVCPLVFENQGDCNGERPAPKEGRGKLIPPTFHGTRVYKDQEIDQFLKPILAKHSATKTRIVGNASRPIKHSRTSESEMGNLVADAIRIKAKTDAAIVNNGGIRASFDSGPITYEALFRALPFDNAITVLKVNGKQLKNILRVAESGPRGFFPVSGLKLKLIDLPYEAPSNDLNKNKKAEPWEINRLIEVRLSDGTLIKDSKTYTLALPDFLVTGGDDFGWVMSQIPAERITWAGAGLLRDAVETYLAQSGQINSPERPLVDPTKLRLKLQASKKKSHHKRRAHP